jgi:predicted metal-binding transcription factor (methanogenesis marker protein 9)
MHTTVHHDQTIMDEDFKFQFHEIVVSMDRKSLLKINLFSQFIDEASNYLCYGDMVWLCLDSKQCYLEYRDQSFELKNHFLDLMIEKISNENSFMF